MQLKKLIVAVALSATAVVSQAQSLGITCQTDAVLDNETVSKEIIDVNNKYVYSTSLKLTSINSPYDSDYNIYKYKKIKIIVSDKTTLQEVVSKQIFGFKDNNAVDKDAIKKMTYHSMLVFDNTVVLFWCKTEKDKIEIYAQPFDEKLNTKIPIKKVFEFKKYDYPDFFITKNVKAGNKILIGSEFRKEEGDEVKIEYRVLNTNLAVEYSNQTILPYTKTKTDNTAWNTTKAITLEDNGLIYSNVYLTTKTDQTLISKESNVTSLLSIIDPSTGKINSYTFKYKNKNSSKVKFFIQDDKTKVVGLYSDVEKSKYKQDFDGVFYTEINNNTAEISKPVFNEIDEKLKEEFFEYFKSKNIDEKQEEEEHNRIDVYYSHFIDNSINFGIHKIEVVNDDNIVITAVKTIYTTSFPIQTNVVLLNVSGSGKIKWGKRIFRPENRTLTTLPKIKTIVDENKIYVFATNFENIILKEQCKPNKIPIKYKFIGFKETGYEVDYISIDRETGKYNIQKLVINTENIVKKDRKLIILDNLVELQNRIYFVTSDNYQKVGVIKPTN